LHQKICSIICVTCTENNIFHFDEAQLVLVAQEMGSLRTLRMLFGFINLAKSMGGGIAYRAAIVVHKIMDAVKPGLTEELI
jgi:hypothetical protein